MGNHRNSQLARIHLAAKELGMCVDTRRDVIERITGKRSAAELQGWELDAVIKEMKRLGWTPKPGKRTPRASGDAQVRKCRALWIALAEAGAVRDPSDKALRAYAKRMTDRDGLEWLTAAEMRRVIESLKAWAARLEEPTPCA